MTGFLGCAVHWWLERSFTVSDAVTEWTTWVDVLFPVTVNTKVPVGVVELVRTVRVDDPVAGL